MVSPKYPGARARCRVRDLGWVFFFMAAAALPFLGESFHFDEPYQLSIARQILRSPLHPQNFLINWHGTAMPMFEFNTHPLLVPYLLALPLKLARGREFYMRLLCLPVDLLAAASLYLLAARFLERPLGPVLVVLATPAYFINMQHLMTEKWVGAFGFSGLYALVRGLDEGSAAWYWGSAALLGTAMLCKYSAAFLLFPAAAYLATRRMSPRGVLEYAGAAVAPAALHLAACAAAHAGGPAAVARMLSDAGHFPWAGWPHRARALAAFVGGCGGLLGAWPLLLKGARRRATAALAAACVLFVPRLDYQPAARLDRATAVLLAAAGLLALGFMLDRAREAFSARAAPAPHGAGATARDENDRRAASALWSAWGLAVAGLQLLDWSIVSRFVLFLLPPLAFGLAHRLEGRLSAGRLTRLYRLSFAGTLALTLGLALVDRYYADVQKKMAGLLAREYVARGRRVWFTGHWGLQYYMELIGARGIDAARGGWGETRPGDVVLVPENNTGVLPADRVFQARVQAFAMDFPVPLRLIGGGPGGQAAFYSSAWGFLPYSLSLAPVEAYQLVEVRSPPLEGNGRPPGSAAPPRR